MEERVERREVVSFERDGDIAVITVDNPPVNTIDAHVRADLSQALQQLAGQKDIKAVLLRCRGKTFFSGADIGEFSGPPREAEYRALFAQLESLPMPVVAAMHGTVLGGGLEIALACHYRLAAPDTRFGFPEVTLGIIPGAGGTQRMPRLIGVAKTLELILSTKPVSAPQALELGFLDAIIEADLPIGALDYARGLAAGGRGPRRTSERTVDPATATPEIIARLRAQAARQYPNRRAALTAIDAVSGAATLPLAAGLSYEERLVNEAKASPESRAAVHLFFAERAARRVADVPESVAARPVHTAGIIGAGTMGAGITMCCANAGLPVTLLDVNGDALRQGLEAISRGYDAMLKRGRINERQRAERLALIAGSLDYADLADADVLIEAVFEDMQLKSRLFARLGQVAKPGAVLATNTSTLDIGEIARATARAADVIGMHFFAPAQVMPLLEVVRTDLTSAETIQTVMQLSKSLRKTPVLARVGYGFIGNRMMEGYAREAERMVLEGATPRQVDSALERWGMAMGILAVFDMAGIDVGVNVHTANSTRYPPDPSYYQADFALAEAGRLGRKNGKGYYRYLPDDRERHDDPEAMAILQARAAQLGIEQRVPADQEIIERCIYPLINEGFRVLEEGVAQRSSDIDVVWSAGYGFPRYRGGPMFYAETLGLEQVLDGLHRYRARFGPMHWQPAPLLLRLVAEGRSIAEWETERRT